ncbi:uncharacterized protein LOC143878110 [Tasmannia lanceolata]|uniref:uncharacterized protein LOC143878110 n=1 Tax=Tasmannia lanceolata TaxID=3420 RepID=UPI004062C86D
MVNFLVVRAKSAYNAILGRPGQNLLRAVPSAYHQKMKNASESLPIELYDLRDEAQITVNEPAEDLISVPLCSDDNQRVVQIGSSLPETAQQDLAQFLKDNADVFAWTPSDMPGIDPAVSTHELGVDQTCKPVKQKRRHFTPERRRAIREEVERLLKADFIREIQYPDWLANVVMVKKSNGKWRTCIDFTDLNKACPKDSYPLPKIDQLIDATGTYCYRVMPFGLKNTGATYQRLVNKLFRNQIGRNMEVYVDDMLVKSRSASNHVSDLREAFQVLKEHNMKLNPTKCTFGVGAGKFLGFMPEPGEELILYLSAGPLTVAAVLIREEHNQQKPIYYVSKVLHDAETRYQRVEKLVYALIMAARKLRPYFQAHTIKILADFIAECTVPDSDPGLVAVPSPEAELVVPERRIEIEAVPPLGTESATSSAYLHPNFEEPLWEVLAGKFKSFEVVRVPRTENAKADVLSKLAASGYTALREIRMEFLEKSSIDGHLVKLMQIDDEPSWMDQIVRYLRSGELPEEKKEARRVASGGREFVVVAIDYFTKWVEAEPLAKITEQNGIKKRLDDKAGRWADELYHVLWAYRTTPRTATGESPFNLSFGTEAVIPVDIGVPSPRIVDFNEQLNGTGLRANLDLLEEVREESQIRAAAYKQKVSKYHDAKIRSREFCADHLVLRKAAVSQPRRVGKLSPTWEGPYRVKEVIRPGSYRLESLDEQMLPHAWNSRNLWIYYQ